nr:hypothetical protein CFP56_00717 [Quercus suber]
MADSPPPWPIPWDDGPDRTTLRYIVARLLCSHQLHAKHRFETGNGGTLQRHVQLTYSYFNHHCQTDKAHLVRHVMIFSGISWLHRCDRPRTIIHSEAHVSTVSMSTDIRECRNRGFDQRDMHARNHWCFPFMLVRE